MSVSSALPGTPFAAIFSARLTDAAALSARCGDDVVRLRPSWPAVIAATRFARRARWRFGNRAATLECIEPQAKRWLNQRGPGDPVQVHFRLDRWATAYARADGRSREIDVFAADGSAIAAVHLDDADPSLDELIWLLADDDQRRAFPPRPRGTAVRRPFASGVLGHVLVLAFDAGLPLQIRLENGGGSVEWSPRAPVVVERDGCVELRSTLGRVSMCDRRGGIWSLRDDLVIEARSTTNVPWLEIKLVPESLAQHAAWREICALLR
jgi:hypothetical protein